MANLLPQQTARRTPSGASRHLPRFAEKGNLCAQSMAGVHGRTRRHVIPLEKIANTGKMGRRRRWVSATTGDGFVGGRRLDDIVDELGGSGAGPSSIPISRLIDVRHQLTALIKSELYGGGNKNEGRAALAARRGLDEFFFHTEQSQLTRGKVADLDTLKRAIILTTLAEQVTLLDEARDADGGSRKGIKAEMQKLMNDPDRFDRFNDEDKAALRKIANGLAVFARSRFDRLNESIRMRGVPHMPARR